ncbi:MAG: adenine phosphoribosyltransferase [Proteobacteria bacterium]|nr:adenine phosphoribosyltransferase [Pseudomonadota bacterium]
MAPKEITDPRFISILKHTDISKKGLEIAPYHHPILPKADGHDVLILDVFDTDRLRLNAKNNPAFDEAEVAKVEPVDFVGDACDLGAIITKAGMAGQFGYVISSHNFEHLANPIKFLQGVGVALETGGVLSMAVPDYRLCFDKFRVPTRLSDWLVAYHSDKKQPAPADMFDQSMGSTRMPDSSPYIVALENPSPPKPYLTVMNFRDQYQVFCEKLKTPGPYQDTHCSAVFPEMLELYLRDLRHLGLIDLELIDSPEQHGGEFFVYLKKVATPSQTSDEDHCKVRESLLRRVSEQIGNGGFVREASKEIKPRWRKSRK